MTIVNQSVANPTTGTQYFNSTLGLDLFALTLALAKFGVGNAATTVIVIVADADLTASLRV